MDVPDEVLLHIFSFVRDMRDRLRLLRVSVQWRRVSGDASLWRAPCTGELRPEHLLALRDALVVVAAAGTISLGVRVCASELAGIERAAAVFPDAWARLIAHADALAYIQDVSGEIEPAFFGDLRPERMRALLLRGGATSLARLQLLAGCSQLRQLVITDTTINWRLPELFALIHAGCMPQLEVVSVDRCTVRVERGVHINSGPKWNDPPPLGANLRVFRAAGRLLDNIAEPAADVFEGLFSRARTPHLEVLLTSRCEQLLFGRGGSGPPLGLRVLGTETDERRGRHATLVHTYPALRHLRIHDGRDGFVVPIKVDEHDDPLLSAAQVPALETLRVQHRYRGAHPLVWVAPLMQGVTSLRRIAIYCHARCADHHAAGALGHVPLPPAPATATPGTKLAVDAEYENFEHERGEPVDPDAGSVAEVRDGVSRAPLGTDDAGATVEIACTPSSMRYKITR